VQDRIKIKHVETLSADWRTLKKTTFDYRRADGAWQTMSRETYGGDHVAVILLYDKRRGTVVLTRQFRYAAYACGHSGMMIEACAGMLEGHDPRTCAMREAEEETGYRVRNVRALFELFMSPGAVSEKLFFFIGEYSPASRIGNGGGLAAEGEDIEVLELAFDEALAMIERGEIVDGKTILLLQYARLQRLFE